VRKGQKSQLTVHWGGEDLLDDFYAVFSRNMRDLGTPVYGRDLFRSVLAVFPNQSELCVVRAGSQAVAAALLLHGWGITEVPSASSLREFNSSNANMLMYWHLLERAIGRGQSIFDFGRSTVDGNTFRFKAQWGAEPHTASWQHYVRRGSPLEMRPNHPKHQRRIRIWQRLPVGLTRLIGPAIVRGIP
jgi:FemAB-related protein (PEP-CTERM system-associated)